MGYEKLELMRTVYDAKTSETIEKYGLIQTEKEARFIDYFIAAINKKCNEGYRFNGIVIGKSKDFLIFEKTKVPYKYKVTQYGDDVDGMHCQVNLPKISDFPFYFYGEVDLEGRYKEETGKQPYVAGKQTNAYKEWLKKHDL